MRIALNKIRRDLWSNKGRTALVVLSIAVGVMAIGMIIASNNMMGTQMVAANEAAQPSHGRIGLTGRIDEATLESLTDIPEVVLAAPRWVTSIQWRASPSDDWQDGRIQARQDYEDPIFDLIDLEGGTWPQRDDVTVATNQIAAFGVPEMGEAIYFQLNDRPYAYEVTGLFRDPNVLPLPFDDSPTFYVSVDLFRELTGSDSFSQFYITVPEFSEEAVNAVADRIEKKLDRLDLEVSFVNVTDPSEHFAQSVMDGVGLILTIMAVASMALSTFLIVNTMSALMVQQVPQVGMMKIIGAVRSQITTVYITGVIAYGLLALFIAIPLGALTGDGLARWMLNFLNVPPGPFQIMPQAFVLQILVGLLAPLLAALYPILRGIAVPAAQAINNQGVGQGQYGTRFVDRLLGRIRGLPRMTTLMLRNTFRRLGRVALTQITLTAAGAIFMMVLSTQQSFSYTIDKIFDGLGFDVFVVFDQMQRIDEIIPLVESRPNVDIAEMWVFMNGYAINPNDPTADSYEIAIRGIPRDTQLYVPELLAGRNLSPEDGHAVLFDQKTAAQLGVGVGDQIVLDIDGFENTTWTIVGLILDVGDGPVSTYVHRDTLSRDLNIIGRASVVEIKSNTVTLENQQAIEKDLINYFEAAGIGVGFTMTAIENKDQANAQFSILTTILMIMTVLIAVVGGFGLSGTLSINVMERTREIGVMRAVGASSADISRIFIGEGMILGLMSWLLAIPISSAAGRAFVEAIGVVIEFPFEYLYSSASVWLWGGIIFAIALFASWLPARRATKISVRESLSYE